MVILSVGGLGKAILNLMMQWSDKKSWFAISDIRFSLCDPVQYVSSFVSLEGYILKLVFCICLIVVCLNYCVHFFVYVFNSVVGIPGNRVLNMLMGIKIAITACTYFIIYYCCFCLV